MITQNYYLVFSFFTQLIQNHHLLILHLNSKLIFSFLILSIIDFFPNHILTKALRESPIHQIYFPPFLQAQKSFHFILIKIDHITIICIQLFLWQVIGWSTKNPLKIFYFLGRDKFFWRVILWKIKILFQKKNNLIIN